MLLRNHKPQVTNYSLLLLGSTTEIRNLKALSNCSSYKWKNLFYEMKGDVGMSGHEKERQQEDAFTQTQTQVASFIVLA